MQDLSGRKFGQYELRERLGRGGMAEVYKAYQASMDRFIAVKVMLGHLADDDDFVERFRREAQAVGRLRHPHIVNIFDFGIQDDVYYMAMEYIDGGTLKDRMKTIEKFSPPDALLIAAQLADALDYAHKAEMIHRDVKPANIMFSDTSYRDVVLTDFGIARLLNQTGLTATGAYIGTPDYMSPEAGRGDTTDERADIYALGIILYEMLTGTAPYSADTPLAVMLKHVNAPIPTRSEYGEAIPDIAEPIIIKSMAKEPNERYQTAIEMKKDIDKALAVLNETGATAVVPDATSRTGQNKSGETTIRTTVGEMPIPPTPSDKPTQLMDEPPSQSQSLPIGLIATVVVVAIVAIIAFGAFFNQGGDEPDETNITQVAAAETDEVATSEAQAIETVEATPTLSAEDWIERAYEFDSQDDFAMALNAFQQAVALDPDKVDAYLGIGHTAFALKDYPLALGGFSEALRLEPDNFDAAVSVGDATMALGDMEAGLEAWNAALAIKPDDRLVHLRKGQVLVELGNLDEAIENFSFAIDNAPDGGDILMDDTLLARAYQYITLDRIAESRDDFQRVADRNPDNLEAHLGVGYNELRLEDYDAAEQAFLRVLELDDGNYEAVTALAVAYNNSGNFEATTDILDTYITDDYQYENAQVADLYWLRGLSYILRDDQNAAVPDLEQAVTLDETVAQGGALSNLGWTLADLGNAEDGIRYLRRYVEVTEENGFELDQGAVNKLRELETDNPQFSDNPTPESPHTSIAMDMPPHPDNLNLFVGDDGIVDEIDRLILQNLQQIALSTLEIELEENPDNIALLFLQSQVFSSQYDGDLESRQIAERIIELDPESSLGYIALADSYLTYPEYEPEQAREILQENFPETDNPDVLFRLALLADWEAEPDLAFTAEALGATGWRFVDYMSHFLYNSGNYERALPYLQTIDEAYYPAITDYEATANYMGALVQTGQADLALEIANAIVPDMDAWGYADIAVIAYEAGNYDLAQDWARNAKALEENILHADWILALAVWWGDNDLETAQALILPLFDEENVYSRFLNDKYKHTLALDYGRILQDSGDLDGALEYYNIAVENFSYQAWVYEERADLFIARDELELAQEDLRTAFEIVDDSDYRRDLIERLREIDDLIEANNEG